jgi:hypothetical protein
MGWFLAREDPSGIVIPQSFAKVVMVLFATNAISPTTEERDRYWRRSCASNTPSSPNGISSRLETKKYKIDRVRVGVRVRVP